MSGWPQHKTSHYGDRNSQHNEIQWCPPEVGPLGLHRSRVSHLVRHDCGDKSLPTAQKATHILDTTTTPTPLQHNPYRVHTTRRPTSLYGASLLYRTTLPVHLSPVTPSARGGDYRHVQKKKPQIPTD